MSDADRIQVRLKQDRQQHQISLPLRVTPRGGKDAVLPYEVGDTEIRLKVSAPPEDGKANTAVIRLLSDILAIAKSRLTIIQGDTSRHKQVAISLSNPEEASLLLARLAKAMQTQAASCFQLLE